MDSKSIIITGHSYVFPYYFKVFEYLENKNDFIFVLPKLWLAKDGKIKITLQPKPGFTVRGLGASSYGGHGLGGLLKGFLPGLISLLPYLKFQYGSKVLFSCSEPNLLTTLFNGLVAKLFGYKLVLFTWQNVLPEQRMSGFKLQLSNMLVSFNLQLADGVICGNSKAELIVKNFSGNVRTIVCPVSGVDIEKFKPGPGGDWREELKLPVGKTVLFYGALDKRKGVEVLVKAVDILKDHDLKLVVVGNGPLEVDLDKLTMELGLKERIVFLPWLENDRLPSLINSSDIFVYPSVPVGGWEEQFGYAMAEASACGLPVVSTKTGSIGEVVVDGQSGILMEPNNPEQLAVAILQLLSDDNLRKSMGEAGRQYVVNNFSHQVVAGRISSFLKQFLNG